MKTSEKPILFSAPMVRAILAGNKTQTRRVVKPQPDFAQVHTWRGQTIRDCESRGWCWKQHDFGDGDAVNANPGSEMAALCPYGVKGDRLWVRETFTHIRGNGIRTWYRADGEPRDSKGEILATRAGEARWFPSIYMPRHESRITLELTGVRVERLQAITDDDAKTEGIVPMTGLGADQPFAGENRGRTQGSHPHALAYAVLWDTINDARPGCSWADNPFVWVVSFKRVKP